jgi:dipeptidyl aminopeptidase/acylaminoacyl peptidase
VLLITAVLGGVPFTVEEMQSLNRIGELDASGDMVVYTSSFWDQKTNIKTQNLKIIQNGNEIQLTKKQGVTDFNPRLIGQNKVAFLSTRDDVVQLYTVQVNSQESSVTKVTNLPVDINGFKYSQTGKFYILQIDVFPDCDTLQCTADRDAKASKQGWMHFDKLMVRNWDHWTTGKVAHLFILRENQQTPTDLMKGLILNSPVPTNGGPEQYDISPDGSEIAFTTEDVSTSAAAWTTGWRIYTTSTTSSSPKCITLSIPARTQNPNYSPDGKTIAYLAMDRPGFEADRLHINLYDRKSSSTKALTDHIDISFDGIAWDANSQYLIADGDQDGEHKLFSISTQGKLQELVGQYQNSGTVLSQGTNSTFFYLRNSMLYPNEVWGFNFNGGISNLKPITAENQKFLEQFDLITPEKFYYPGSLGAKIQGFYLKPVGFDENKVWPLVILIHGGPQSPWNNDWSFRWNPQMWASRGYAVAMFNFHGSPGFGQNFTDIISGNWGSYPYWDIINGTNYVLAQNKYLHKQLVSACGASYGGYMINWIMGQSSMFNSLVVHDGMFDTVSAYYTTEQLWFPEWEFKGKPWTSRDIYDKWNPSNYVTNWATPALVIHGGRDYRLDITQGLSVFTTLQRLGIPSKLLVFPEENHWVLNPNNGIKWYHSVLDWLDQWNKAQ